MKGYFGRQCRREMLLHLRQPRPLINACLFFMMMTVFFPLAMPADMVLLRQTAPGLIWITMLLAMLLASEQLFQQDYEDGVLEQWIGSGSALLIMVLAKLLLHWLFLILPLVLMCPLFSLLFGFSSHELLILMSSLLLGTPAILSLCALAAAFGLGLSEKGIGMALILLPLSVPVMIFGSGTVMMSMQGLSVSASLALLLALSLLAVSFIPFAITAVIREMY